MYKQYAYTMPDAGHNLRTIQSSLIRGGMKEELYSRVGPPCPQLGDNRLECRTSRQGEFQMRILRKLNNEKEKVGIFFGSSLAWPELLH